MLLILLILYGAMGLLTFGIMRAQAEEEGDTGVAVFMVATFLSAFWPVVWLVSLGLDLGESRG